MALAALLAGPVRAQEAADEAAGERLAPPAFGLTEVDDRAERTTERLDELERGELQRRRIP